MSQGSNQEIDLDVLGDMYSRKTQVLTLSIIMLFFSISALVLYYTIATLHPTYPTRVAAGAATIMILGSVALIFAQYSILKDICANNPVENRFFRTYNASHYKRLVFDREVARRQADIDDIRSLTKQFESKRVKNTILAGSALATIGAVVFAALSTRKQR